MDLTPVGLAGVKYVYAGKFKRLVNKYAKVRLKTDPWKMSEEDFMETAKQLQVEEDALENAIFAMADAYDSSSKKKRSGTPSDSITDISWSDAIKYNAKGDASGLNAGVIARLLSNGYVRVDNVIFKVENNIGAPVKTDDIKIRILDGLKSVNGEEFYGTNTYTLVRDQLLSTIPDRKLGDSQGIIPMKNGVLDICKGELISVDDIYVKTTNINFDPSMVDCPKIQVMLDNMFSEEQRELVLSVIGAAISGRRAPFILILSGSGRNGKSLFREILEALMMEMITTEQLENLNKTFINEVFLGKRIAWQTEVEASRHISNQIKEVTGGTTIQLRKKFIDGTLQYPLQMVAIIDTNSPPPLDESQAINDRIRFVNMPHKFVYKLTGKPNEILIDSELTNGWQKELPAFFNKLLPYAQFFIQKGRLMYDIENTMEQLRERSDLIGNFLEDMCEDKPGLFKDVRTIHKHYVKYAEKKNVSALVVQQFRHKIRKEFGYRMEGNNIIGIRLKENTTLD